MSHQQLRFSLSPDSVVYEGHPELHFSANPFLGDICNPSKPPKVVDRPYEQAISAGKNTYVYDAHTYHTKVPPEGIERLVEYYTEPGDVVLDPFCGSGMTGLAATNLGRKAILSDLSPAAVFIAYNLNTPIDGSQYLLAVDAILDSASELEMSLYGTSCRRCGVLTPMLYTVWSYGLICRHCGKEFILWDVARDERPIVRDSKIKSEFDCPHCGKGIQKRGLKRTQRYPVQIGYSCCQRGRKESTSPLDLDDQARLERIDRAGVPDGYWYPTAEFPDGVNTKQAVAAGIISVDKAYTPRALTAMAFLWRRASEWPDEALRQKLLFTITSLYQRVTVFSEFRFWGGSGNTANYNVPAIMNEQNVFRAFARKARTIGLHLTHMSSGRRVLEVSTQSACHLPQLADGSVDYAFTDPPFGANINYSEMNFLWESWLQKYTDIKEEAIVNRIQKKGVAEYGRLLTDAFSETHRVLKAGAWLSVVFHNSSHLVWGALQRAIGDAGFRIDGTQTFDKKHGTFKQFVSDNAVGYDLVLHCRKSVARRKLVVGDHQDAVKSAAEFAAESIRHDPDRYVQHYIHVTRPDEFDYRRLYADWLVHALQNDTLVTLSFEEFRGLVEPIRRGE